MGAGIALVVIGLSVFAFGALVFAGSERCYRILAGGESFLALDPDEADLRKSARLSGAAVCLVAIALWCTAAQMLAPVDGALGAVLLVAPIASWGAVAVLIVLQVKQYADVLRRPDRG